MLAICLHDLYGVCMSKGDIMNSTIVYGTAAQAGGKIHRTNKGDHAWCLRGNGSTPLRFILVEVTNDAPNFDAEIDALRNANIKATSLCQKCCGTVVAQGGW